jgi:hypothetical protein
VVTADKEADPFLILMVEAVARADAIARRRRRGALSGESQEVIVQHNAVAARRHSPALASPFRYRSL